MIDGTYTEGKPITLHVALDTKHFQCKNILLSKYNDFKIVKYVGCIFPLIWPHTYTDNKHVAGRIQLVEK